MIRFYDPYNIRITHFVWPRWFVNQIHVNEMIVEDPTVQKNKHGGVTMGVTKHGGWSECFKKAKIIGGWSSEPVHANGGA